MYCAQVKWEGWMDSQKEFTVDSRLRFSDIIVPTMDTVRSNFMVELLTTNSKPVRIHHYHVVFLLISHTTTMWFLHSSLSCYLSTNPTHHYHVIFPLTLHTTTTLSSY